MTKYIAKGSQVFVTDDGVLASWDSSEIEVELTSIWDDAMDFPSNHNFIGNGESMEPQKLWLDTKVPCFRPTGNNACVVISSEVLIKR